MFEFIKMDKLIFFMLLVFQHIIICESFADSETRDYLHTCIPKNATEKIIPLTKEVSWCSKKAEYWLHGEKVGERTWWKNGNLSTECPMQQGKKHGVLK